MLPENQSPISRSQPYPKDDQTNVLAIVSLISSLLSWVMLPVLGAVVGVVCGHIARSQLRYRPNEPSSIMALLGLIIGYVQLVLLVLVLVAIVFFGWAIFQNA